MEEWGLRARGRLEARGRLFVRAEVLSGDKLETGETPALGASRRGNLPLSCVLPCAWLVQQVLRGCVCSACIHAFIAAPGVGQRGQVLSRANDIPAL